MSINTLQLGMLPQGQEAHDRSCFTTTVLLAIKLVIQKDIALKAL